MQHTNIVTVQVAVKNRLRTRSFVLVPELLGETHQFHFDSILIQIELPTAQEITDHNHRSSRAYKLDQKNLIVVKDIDLIVSTNEKVRIPEQALNMPFERDLYYFEQKQNKSLDEIAKKYANFAARAFERWVRVMRWKGHASINGPELKHDIRVKPPILIDKESKKQFFFPSIVRWGMSYRITTLESWRGAQEVLLSDYDPPIHVDLLSDAVVHFNSRDLQRCVVDLAVACESFLRSKVVERIPEGAPDSFRKHLDEVNIRRIIEYSIKDILSESEKKSFDKIRSNLNKLLDARNKIAHIGRKDDITVEQCLDFLKTAYILIEGEPPIEGPALEQVDEDE